MFRCKFCSFCTYQLRRHLLHRLLHSNLTNKYWCGYCKCSKSFRLESSLRTHVRREHRQQSNCVMAQPLLHTTDTVNRDAKFVCSINLCKKECDNRRTLIKHLKAHIRSDQSIQCPFEGCDNVYRQLNSFTGHLSRKHSAAEEDDIVHKPGDHNLIDEESAKSTKNKLTAERVARFDDVDDINMADDEADMENAMTNTPECLQVKSFTDLFLQNVAQFYLKLECQFLIPSSTIQNIDSESRSTHDLNQRLVKNDLRSLLFDEGFAMDKVDTILDDAFNADPFVHGLDTLKTIFRRKKFYKETFAYIDPIEVLIEDSNTKKKLFHYVPVDQTLMQLFSDKSLASELNYISELSDPDVLSDIIDGSVFQESTFFKENPDGLRLILYQDAFEVVNPIGSAVQKHKILAIYMSIGNLPEYIRSHVNSVKLVALCKEKEFDHKKVYGRIVEDLKKIETEGIQLPSGRIVKGALLFIAGDNLGSHQLGGFVENFSTSTHFCRFCLITRDKLQDKGSFTAHFQLRTVESYNAALDKIGDKQHYEGVKFNSIFNSLTAYHVCQPGLPPCLGHDLLEGIVAYDLKLFIDQIVKKGWISYADLNTSIASFRYSTADTRDRPCLVSNTKKKIVGGAWQIWIFLKLLPLLIHDKIEDIDSNEWHCILLLTEIVEITCAPVINKSYLPYLSTIINEYLILRMRFAPNLRPKHHYLTHYPELILRFGPLMKVWTMRFESKHAYFKRALRFSRNYINVTKAMTEKHELLQCLLRAGMDLRPAIETKGNVKLNCDMFNEEIQAVIKKINQSNCLERCDEVIVKGTIYKNGDALFIDQKGYQYGVQLGRISMLLRDEENLLVLLEVVKTVFRPHLRAYELGSRVKYDCLSLNNHALLSTEALHVYKVGNHLYVKPTYGLVQ